MKLTKDLIAPTHLWALNVRIDAGGMSVLLTGPESNGRSVLFRRMEFGPVPAAGLRKAVEEAVYDHPLLLSDFRSVSVSFDTAAFALLPAEAADTAAEVAAALNPDPELPVEAVSCPMGQHSEVVLAMLVPAELLHFVRRTFANPSLHHPLQDVVTYLAHTNANGNPERTYAILLPDTMLLAAFAPDNTLTLANRYPTDGSAQTAAYHVMAAAAATGADDAPLLIGGTPAMRNELAALLRPYRRLVMPLTLSDDLLYLLDAAPDATLDQLMLSLL